MSFGTGDIPGSLPVPANSTIATNATDDAWITVPIPSATATYSQSTVTRSFNTAFTPSATSDMAVSYSVSINTSLSLSGGTAGTVSLQIAPTSGGTYTTISQISNTQTGTLTVGLALNQSITGVLSGTVPAGYSAKIVTANTTGTPTFAYVYGQESTTI